MTLNPVRSFKDLLEASEEGDLSGYTCTDGTLLLRTCALISWTLVMIFFWWPINVTPSLWMSLQDKRTEKTS